MVLIGTITAYFLSVILILFFFIVPDKWQHCIQSKFDCFLFEPPLYLLYLIDFWFSLTLTNCLHLFNPIILKPRTALFVILHQEAQSAQPYIWGVQFTATLNRNRFKRMLFTSTLSVLIKNRYTCHVSIVNHFKCSHMNPFGNVVMGKTSSVSRWPYNCI